MLPERILPAVKEKHITVARAIGSRAGSVKGGAIRYLRATPEEWRQMSAKGSMGYFGKISKEKHLNIVKMSVAARMENTTPEKRREIARIAALARWSRR